MTRFSNIFLSYFSGHQTTSEEVLSEPWFLALLGSVVLTVLILIFVGIILYRKQWSRQKGLGQLSLPGIIIKVHIFWEGHKILQNLHRRFVLCSNGQIYGGDFAKFWGLLRIYEL